MKDDAYTDIICKEFCKYYKEGKEELHCNGYVFLRDNFTPHELKTMLENSAADGFPGKSQTFLGREQQNETTVCRTIALSHYRTKDEELINLICKKCDFFVDGCDYIDNQSGPPCGGYLIISFISSYPFKK
jgi:hypothetical protein